VDDEFHAIEVLANYVDKTPNIQLLGKCDDPVLALQEINETTPDLVFVDIEMPVISGLEFKNLIKDTTSIVFTTAQASFAVDAFNQGHYDFLLKPIKYERFLKSIQKITEIRKKEESLALIDAPKKDHIFIQSGLKGQMIRIPLVEILYIESLNNYVIIYLKEEKHIVYLTLKEIIQTLPAESFSRIHKSIIVNDEKIKLIEGNRVVINEKTKLAIGNSFKDGFLEKIFKNLIKRKIN
jgi:DNA-binding LytR/AlgR family response regulator